MLAGTPFVRHLTPVPGKKQTTQTLFHTQTPTPRVKRHVPRKTIQTAAAALTPRACFVFAQKTEADVRGSEGAIKALRDISRETTRGADVLHMETNTRLQKNELL